MKAPSAHNFFFQLIKFQKQSKRNFAALGMRPSPWGFFFASSWDTHPITHFLDSSNIFQSTPHPPKRRRIFQRFHMQEDHVWKRHIFWHFHEKNPTQKSLSCLFKLLFFSAFPPKRNIRLWKLKEKSYYINILSQI